MASFCTGWVQVFIFFIFSVNQGDTADSSFPCVASVRESFYSELLRAINKLLEARSNYRRSYLWGLWNFAYGDSNGSNRVEKDWIEEFSGLAWEMEVEKMGDGVGSSSVCVSRVLLDDWANGSCVYVLLS